MMKYNQPVGRLRDRAPSLLAGRFELERRRYMLTKQRILFKIQEMTQANQRQLSNGLEVFWALVKYLRMN